MRPKRVRTSDRKLKRYQDRKTAKSALKWNNSGKSKSQIYQDNYQEQAALDARQREIIEALPEAVKCFGAIVGRWIWIWYAPHFVPRVKPHYDLLKKLGFFWNIRRSAWQNPCGVESSRTEGNPLRHYTVRHLGEVPACPSIPAKVYTEEEMIANGTPF